MPKGPGSKVSAGTVNVGGGVLQVVTTAAAGDSAVARMAALVEKVRLGRQVWVVVVVGFE